MICVFMDPSYTVIGYSIWESKGHGSILMAGKVEFPKLKRLHRLGLMLAEMQNILWAWRANLMVIEIPSGKVNPLRHKGGGSGLSLYGFGVGALWYMCGTEAAKCGGRVVGVTAEKWTGGHPKAKREAVALKTWPRLKQISDKGHDVADAIALGKWWFSVGRKEFE